MFFAYRYAPRNEEEVQMVLEIVGAAKWFVCAGDSYQDRNNLRSKQTSSNTADSADVAVAK